MRINLADFENTEATQFIKEISRCHGNSSKGNASNKYKSKPPLEEFLNLFRDGERKI